MENRRDNHYYYNNNDMMKDFKPIIAIMNARLIPMVLGCYESLPYPKVWISFFWESGIMEVFPEVLGKAEQEGYTHLSMVSDDAVIDKDSVDLIYYYAEKYPNCVFSGWANIDSGPLSNIASEPLGFPSPPPFKHVKFYTIEEMEGFAETSGVIRTWLTGMCLHTMSIELWKKFPFQCYMQEDEHSRGFSSDYNICYRLQQAGVPMFCVPGSRMTHLKVERGKKQFKLWVRDKQSEIKWDHRRSV